MRHHTRLTPLGDRALLVEVGHTIDPATQERVLAVYQALGDAHIPGVTELVPAYTSIAVHYDPARFEHEEVMPYDAVARLVTRIVDAPLAARRRDPRVIEIPVRYGGSDGPDLDDVARHTGLPPDEVIRRHAAAEYTVGMVGFIAGFAYLAGLPKELAVPRRSSPRTEVPKGSVGIGGEQTGIYPVVTPGGWNLIGRTALELYSPANDPPTLLAPGDHVRFVPVESP